MGENKHRKTKDTSDRPWDRSVRNMDFPYHTEAKILGFLITINLLTPNVNYSGRTAPLTYKIAFYIFIQQI